MCAYMYFLISVLETEDSTSLKSLSTVASFDLKLFSLTTLQLLFGWNFPYL